MFIPTHRIIANHVYYNVNSKLDFKLNKYMLQIGNMKPDLIPSLKSKKHYKEPTFNFVLDEIISLIDFGAEGNIISINDFSNKLGVITHFLSDFFCLPHHDRGYYFDKLNEHMNYEKNLHFKFKEFNGIEKINSPSIKGLDKESIKNYINELHFDYSNSTQGYLNDIKSSINVSSAISVLIIQNSLNFQSQLIAV